MRGRYFCHIVIAATLFFFAAALPVPAETGTIQKSAPATKPVQKPLQKRTLPEKTGPTVKQPAPAKKASVDSVKVNGKTMKGAISLEQGTTATITVNGKDLDLIDKIDVAGGKRGDVTVKVISSSKTMKKISLTAKRAGTYQVKFRAGTRVVKTVSVKINTPEKVYRTAKIPAAPAPSAKPAEKKPAKPSPKPAPSPAKSVAKKPGSKQAAKIPAQSKKPLKKTTAIAKPVMKPESTKSVSPAAKPKAKSTVAKKPVAGLPPKKVATKTTPGEAKGTNPRTGPAL
jgi:hypothetical protein